MDRYVHYKYCFLVFIFRTSSVKSFDVAWFFFFITPGTSTEYTSLEAFTLPCEIPRAFELLEISSFKFPLS